ncbi:MAG: ABC transporter substrate-binding protein [Spirulinaceae cyanobacterium]
MIQHTMGETAVPENPQRIVALEPFALEALLAMGIKPVGAPLEGVNPYLQDRVEGITNISNPPNLERVFSLKPDLILGSQYQNQDIYSQASQIAPTILFSFTGSSDWKAITQLVGNTINQEDLSTKVLNDYRQRLEKFQAEMGDSYSNLKISLVRVYPDAISLYQKGSFAGTIIADAGLSRPSAQQRDDVQIKVSKERILDADGDVMFLWTYSNNADREAEAETALQQLKADPLWSKLNVVQQGNVYEVGEHWLGTGAIAANLAIDDLFNYLLENDKIQP